jgi:hypothetical protein
VVDKVAADTGKLGPSLDGGRGQLLGRAQAASQQHRRRAVGTGGHHHPVGCDLHLLSVHPDDHPGDPRSLHVQPVDQGVGQDGEVRPASGGVEVGEGRVPANGADGVDLDRCRALGGLGVVEVLQQRQAHLHGPLQPGPVERVQVLDA